jgi:hypothetical protein
LVGRRHELKVLSSFLDDVRGRNSRVLVMVGGPGVGKTALFDRFRARATGCRVEVGAGVESEMELPFAGLHQLLTPMLGGIGRLPAPQREALQTAFGISSGSAPDRFLVGLATLSLLSDHAEAEPLCCFIDDLHWLDRASAQVLAFVGRRLRADSVGLLFASRARFQELAGFDELRVDGLAEPDARTLLDSVLPTPLDARMRDRIIAEADGNPLALSVGITCVQDLYSLLDRSGEPILELCREHGLAWVPFFPLGSAFQGMAAKVTEHPAVVAQAAALGATPAQVGLAWLLAHDPHILLIPGTSNLDHLAENVAAGDIRLGPETTSTLNGLGTTARPAAL